MTTEYVNTEAEYTALSETNEDEPTVVSGVALGEGDITHGASGKATLWPRETLEPAAEGLQGQPIATDENHDTDAQPQTPSKAVIGENTWSGYKPGLGVLYEGEVDDPDIARSVKNERLEVSPLVARDVEPLEGDLAEEYAEKGYDVEAADYVATEIHGWRDLAAVVSGAAPSNEISVGGQDMKAEALAEAVTETQSGGSESVTVTIEGDTDAVASVSAALDGEDSGGSSDDPSGASTSGTDTNETETMSDEPTETESLSETEVAVLEAADSVEEPVDALNEIAACETATVVEQNEYEALEEEVGEIESLMRDALSERTSLKESTLEALSFGALKAEFETEDGEFEAEALVQNPETGQPNEEASSVDDAEVEALIEDVGASDKTEAVEALEANLDRYERAGWETQAEQTKQRLETLGVEVN